MAHSVLPATGFTSAVMWGRGRGAASRALSPPAGKGAVYSFDPVGSYQRDSFKAGGSASAMLQPLLDNQVRTPPQGWGCPTCSLKSPVLAGVGGTRQASHASMWAPSVGTVCRVPPRPPRPVSLTAPVSSGPRVSG